MHLFFVHKFKTDLERHDLLSMVAGDFSEIYSRPEQHGKWNVIVSCFFIDTAHNILEYLEIMSKCLVINGYIINLGPLLYHFEDQSDPSIELTYNEIMNILPIFGFKIIYERKRENALKCAYAQNPNSMIQNYYNCAFWIAQKIKDVDIEQFVKMKKEKEGNESKEDNGDNGNDNDNDSDDDGDIALKGHSNVGGDKLPNNKHGDEVERKQQLQNQLVTQNLQFATQKIMNDKDQKG